jgi:hypothetical protein
MVMVYRKSLGMEAFAYREECIRNVAGEGQKNFAQCVVILFY